MLNFIMNHLYFDVRLQRVEEKLDLILEKINAPTPPTPEFVTEIQLKKALENVVARTDARDKVRLDLVTKTVLLKAYQMISLVLGKVCNAPHTLEKL
ncbi:hypothetical protein L2E82_30681 [Cichorium intybus]|uniref:Uncharacterized protein n=1 Tax=Cichorium intybus TaxID=13427 RepID=A0ACB9D1A3_CICIN|nr:hypothetical protein L2E82_30681 [Cichorium intybus]